MVLVDDVKAVSFHLYDFFFQKHLKQQVFVRFLKIVSGAEANVIIVLFIAFFCENITCYFFHTQAYFKFTYLLKFLNFSLILII